MKRLKSCCGVQNHKFSALPLVDRLTSLPDELLIRILSLLPTKDAAATSILSSKLRRVFPYITSLDFDVSPINLCVEHPFAIQRYPTFVNFVDTVLQSYKSKYLSRFRLQISSIDFYQLYYVFAGCCSNRSRQGCLPDLKFARVDAWISFPLRFCGLRELDLCILLRDPGDNAQLPPAIFTCETLQVLKLEANIGLDEVIAMPSYRLPSLKRLLFSMSFISDDDFLPRLVSSCPVLEDLRFEVFTGHVRHTTVSSTSLRRLCLQMQKLNSAESDNTDIVVIDTPNLEYFDYSDNLAFKYSIPIMHHLVEAKLQTLHILRFEGIEVSFQNILCLMTACSHAQHISVLGFMLEEFSSYAGEKVLRDQLPKFPNLKRLELQCDHPYVFWDELILPFLNCSPALETLVFTDGLTLYYEDGDTCIDGVRLELEREFFRTDHAIPSCCRYCLKKIVIQDYYGLQREVEMIQFLLRHALVLEELVVCLSQTSQHVMPDLISVENTLNNLPKASVTCSIQVS